MLEMTKTLFNPPLTLSLLCYFGFGMAIKTVTVTKLQLDNLCSGSLTDN